MTRALLIAWRELKSYFWSWTAYLVIAGFLAISGFIFFIIVVDSRQADMQWCFHNMARMLLLVCPILTMGLLAEERRAGTLELLVTSPVTDVQVIIGKFLGAVALLAALLAATFYLPLIVLHFASPDPGPLLSGYLGLLLLGASFMAVGVLASSLTSSQVVAGFLSFGALLALWIIGWVSAQPGSITAALLEQLSLLNHFQDLAQGVVDTRDIIFYLSLIVVSLFGAVRALERGKWR